MQSHEGPDADTDVHRPSTDADRPTTAKTLANLRVSQLATPNIFHGSSHVSDLQPPWHEHQPHLGDMVPAAALIRRTVHHLHQALSVLAVAAAPPSRSRLQPHQQPPQHHHYVSSDKIRRDLIGLVQLAHRLLAKLAACLSWAQDASSAYVLAQSLWAHVQHVDLALKHSLDKLRHLNLLIAAAKHANRNPDVPTAAVVLSTGSYPFLPLPGALFKDAAQNTSQRYPLPIAQAIDSDTDPDPALLDHLNDAVRSRLLLHECAIPPVFAANHHIDRGLVSFSVPNEFSITLALPGGFDPTAPWTMVDVTILDPSVFQHFDELTRNLVQQNLMILGNIKLNKDPATNSIPTNPGETPTTVTKPPSLMQSSSFDVPLIELYHVFHHIFLSMRLEALYFQAGTRDQSSGPLAAIKDPDVDEANKSMRIRLWWGTFNAQSLAISTTTTAQELLFNASQHPTLSPVPLVSTTPTVCAVGSNKVTSSILRYQATNLVLQFGPLRLSIPPRISLESLVTWCMRDYARESLSSLHNLLTQHNISSYLSFASDSLSHEQRSANVGASVEHHHPFDGEHLILPDHGLAITIHRTSGQFSVSPLDRFHTDLKHVLSMINKAPLALPDILRALTMSQRLGNLEASLSFDGLEPCPQDTPLTHNNHIVIDHADLGPSRLARVLQLPYDPEYRLYLSMADFPSTKAFIVRWGAEEKRIIHDFEYSPDMHIVDLLRYFALVDRVNRSLLKHGFPVSWNGAWLKIDPSAILLRPAIQLMVSFMSVTVHVNSRMPLTLTILFSRSIPGLPSTLLTKSCPSVSELITYTFKCFGLVSLFAFLPAASTSICRANFDSCTIDLNLPTGDSVTLQPTDPLVIKTPPSNALPGVRFPPFETTNRHLGAVLSLMEQGDNAHFQAHIGHLVPLLIMWSRISRIETLVAPPTVADGYPRILIKSVTSGAILFGPTAKLHVCISAKDQIVVFRGEGWCPLPEVNARLHARDQTKASKYSRLVDAGELTSLVCASKLLEACMTAIAQACEYDGVYIGGLGTVREATPSLVNGVQGGVEPGRHKQALTEDTSSLPVKHGKVVRNRLVFVWGTVAFELSTTQVQCSKHDASASQSRRSGSSPEFCLQPQQQLAIGNMLSQSWRHALESGGLLNGANESLPQEQEAHFDKLLRALLKFLTLPQGILRCIARAVEGLPASSFALLLSPPARVLAPSISKAIPEHPESCLVVQGPKTPRGRDMTVSMVFALPSPRVTNGPEYVPLVYSWSGSVVSPWESKDGFDGGDDDVIMNPSAVLAMLGMGDSSTSPGGAGDSGGREGAANGSGFVQELKPTVRELLAEIKSESITQSSSEDSLLWSLTRLIQRWRGYGSGAGGA